MKNESIQTKLWLIAGVYILINILQSFFTPLIDDEAYYWFWSQNLDWGYYDHPPMVALWGYLGFSLFQNELGFRLISVLFGGLGFILLANLLRVKTKPQLRLYSLLFFSMVLFQVFGFINTPDAPLLFFTILYLYILKKFLSNKNIYNSLLLGLSMALLIYSKYHGILLIVFSLLPHAVKLIKCKWFYIATLFGIFCYSPYIIWQFNHDFAPLEYHLVKRNTTYEFQWNYMLEYLLSLIWATSPFLAFHHYKAVFKTKYSSDFSKSLIWSFTAIVCFFGFSTFKSMVQAQWVFIAYIPLFIISYNFYKNRLGKLKYIFILSLITIFLLFVARIYFIAQDVPIPTKYHGWKKFSKEAAKVTKGYAIFDSYQNTSLYNFNNFPDKKAYKVLILDHRKSQYELLNLESELEGKEVTYFSKYIDKKDSVYIDNFRDGSYYYKYIPEYHTAANVNIDVYKKVYSQKNDSVEISAKVTNEGDFIVNLSQENNFTLKKFDAVSPNINYVLGVYDVEGYHPIILHPNETKSIKFKTKVHNKSDENIVTYFGFMYLDIVPRRQSNYIKMNLP